MHSNTAVHHQPSHWSMSSVPCMLRALAAQATTVWLAGCQRFQQFAEVYGERRSGCDYYNGDSKSWRSMKLICGGKKKKERTGRPLWSRSQLQKTH